MSETDTPTARVALVHDWLNQMGGAENVLEEMVALFPGAPIHTSIYAPDKMPEAYRRWPIRTSFMQRLPGSPLAVVVKLMITEGARHPDLVQFYWDNVASRGLTAIGSLLERGVKNGEFRESAVQQYPHLVVAPTIMAVVFGLLFKDVELDTDGLIDTHIEILLEHLKA